MHLAAAVYEGIAHIQRTLGERLSAGPSTVEDVARAWVDSVYEPLAQEIVLARAFAIVPRSTLPAFEAEHADRVAGAAGEVLDDRAPVLALLATRGTRPEWNHRRRSQTHLAVPLCSPTLVASPPMIATLLDEIGVRIASVGCRPRLIAAARETPEFPLFYVADAQTTRDARGRFAIPARDFVNDYDVKTVFGVAGNFGRGNVFALLLFARQHVTRGVAEQLVPLASSFRSQALSLPIFASDS